MKFYEILLKIISIWLFILDFSYSFLKLTAPIIIWLFAFNFLFKEPPQVLVIVMLFGGIGALMKLLGFDLYDFKQYCLRSKND